MVWWTPGQKSGDAVLGIEPIFLTMVFYVLQKQEVYFGKSHPPDFTAYEQDVIFRWCGVL